MNNSGLEIKTLQGVFEHAIVENNEKKNQEPPKHFVEKLQDSANEATRRNVAYLNHAVGKPITDALKRLSAF